MFKIDFFYQEVNLTVIAIKIEAYIMKVFKHLFNGFLTFFNNILFNTSYRFSQQLIINLLYNLLKKLGFVDNYLSNLFCENMVILTRKTSF